MLLLYVNDIADKISPQTRIKLFADDCLLYRTIDTKQDHKQLQQDLNTLVDWSHTWLMTFNAAKCHLLKITRKTKFLDTEYKIDNHTLLRVQHHPYLGVELTSDLTWKHHIGLITGKAQKILNLLRRHLYGCNPDVKKRAFTALVLPHLEYTSTVWDPYHKQDIQALEKVQRKGARFVTGKYSYQDSVTSMLNDLNWQPLQIRRKNKRLIVFHKAVNQNSPVEIPDYVTQSTYSGTRSHSKAFIEIRANYEQYKNSFLPRTIKDWNALPTHLVHVTSVDEFGSRLQSLTT